MGGAAATLGAARILADSQPPGVEVRRRAADCQHRCCCRQLSFMHLSTSPPQVHFIIASCENMVHGKGLRPGDVLVAANGKTVEVNK